MTAAVLALIESLVDRLSGFDAARCTADECITVVARLARLARLEKVVTSARASAAARVADAGRHIDPVANGGATCIDNDAPRCYRGHLEKTDRDRRAGLIGPALAKGRSP